jgi:tetratricopeptide (TPR) repeat protein
MLTVKSGLQLCLLLILLGSQPVAAQYSDEVVQRGSTPGSRITIRCQIIDYTGSKLTYKQSSSDKAKELGSSNVITIRTAQTTAQKDGIKAFNEGKTRDAEFQFTEAVNSEPRVWMRREILSMMVRCALKRNDFLTAGSRFLLLFESDSETAHINLIPLLWNDSTAQGEARTAAVSWLNDEKPIARLMAASWLFFDPDHSEKSLAVFNELARSPGDRIKQLASWQRLRFQIRAGDVTDFNLERWDSNLSKLEPALRPGPIFLLGQGYIVRQDFEIAAATFLKVPLVYDSEHPLSAESMVEAGRALTRIGLRNDAAKLFSEVLDRYAYAVVSEAAREELSQLAAQ